MYIGDDNSVDLTLDWDSAFGASVFAPAAVHASSVSDALILSLSNLGRVDIGYILAATGESYGSAIEQLKGSIFQNPDTWEEDDYKGWETAEEYLSGNLRRKLRSAGEANKVYHGRFSENVRAIKQVLPAVAGAKDIYVTLGSPWVPAQIIDAFIAHILKIGGRPASLTRHDEHTGSWEIREKSYYSGAFSVAAKHTYGTRRMHALEILEKTLNMRTIAVYDEGSSRSTASGAKRKINQSETLLAAQMQQKLIDEFRDWVFRDGERRRRLESIFESKYGCVRRRIFDGSFLRFPGLSSDTRLYPYQKNAVARILFSPNTLLAHNVGSGKSFVMIAAGMELRRMGLSKKNLYVVPNNIVLQWKNFFERLYPNASVLVVDSKSFTPDKRESTLKSVRDGDWDAILMAYSCFDRIPLSQDALMKQMREEKETLEQVLQDRTKVTSSVRRRAEKLSADIAQMAVSDDKTAGQICFDALGISRLFVDEAHNYKNVPIDTKTEQVLGIGGGGSKKCRDMMDKVHFIQRMNGGGGVVLATGTPITNSLTDVYVMQQYLQSGELALLDLATFDSWIGMFAEKKTEFEVDVDTNSYRLATRFSRFHNLPELTALLSSVADFHSADEYAELPEFDGYTDTLVPRSDAFKAYLDTISERADTVRGGRISRQEDNMLKITTDGRKAALDLRLVEGRAEFSPRHSKVALCAKNACEVYTESTPVRGTQLIFCDSSTPKEGFNIYDEVKRLLILAGVDPAEIAFVHDATTEAQREKLFAKVRSGEIRVLLGSTFKLGMGVNVQDRLIAIHHLDVPWRPADMMQREGRILRQGNTNKKVRIFRYITEGSFDAYSYQLLETKQRMICDLLSGSLSERSGADVEGTVLGYAEVKALAIGNPLVKERVETANELSRTLSLQRAAIETNVRLQREQAQMPERIKRQAALIEECREDMARYAAERSEADKETRRARRAALADAIAAHLADPAQEREVMRYQGFGIVLPAFMSRERPYLLVQGRARYFVELGESAQGALVRVDNCLERLGEHMSQLRRVQSDLFAKREAIKKELADKVDYTPYIEALQKKIEKIDKKLEVATA